MWEFIIAVFILLFDLLLLFLSEHREDESQFQLGVSIEYMNRKRKSLAVFTIAALSLSIASPLTQVFAAENTIVFKDKGKYEAALAEYKKNQADFLEKSKQYQEKVDANKQIQQENEQATSAFQAELKKFNEDMALYNTQMADYEAKLAQHNEALDQQKQLLSDYQEKMAKYREELANYQKLLSEYHQHLDEVIAGNNQMDEKYKEALKQYQAALAIYEEQLKEYSEAVANRDEVIQSNQDATNNYQAEQQAYQEKLNTYKEQLQTYNDELAERQKVVESNESLHEAFNTAYTKYQADLATYHSQKTDYDQKMATINDHLLAGHYTMPSSWDNSFNLYSLFTNYTGMQAYLEYGLSTSGDGMVKLMDTYRSKNAIPEGTLKDKLTNSIPVFTETYTFYKNLPITSSVPIYFQTVPSVTNGAKGPNGFSQNLRGQGFDFSFTSSFEGDPEQAKNATTSNIPESLRTPTEQDILNAIPPLFTSKQSFNASNSDQVAIQITPELVDKWKTALKRTKELSDSEFNQAFDLYVQAFKTFNASNRGPQALKNLQDQVVSVNAIERDAVDLISGKKVDLGENNREFLNDLTNTAVSSDQLANKYGYLTLLTKMAGATVFGYYHELTAKPGEVIKVATNDVYYPGYWGLSLNLTKATPVYPVLPIEPTPPTEPEYQKVPDEPVPPVVPEPPKPLVLQEVPNVPAMPVMPIAPTPPEHETVPENPNLVPPVMPEEPVLPEIPVVPELPVMPKIPVQPELKPLLPVGEPPVPPIPPEYQPATDIVEQPKTPKPESPITEKVVLVNNKYTTQTNDYTESYNPQKSGTVKEYPKTGSKQSALSTVGYTVLGSVAALYLWVLKRSRK